VKRASRASLNAALNVLSALPRFILTGIKEESRNGIRRRCKTGCEFCSVSRHASSFLPNILPVMQHGWWIGVGLALAQ
jgi:hypothetical protein